MVFTIYTSQQSQKLLNDHYLTITERATDEAKGSLDDFGERLKRLQTNMSRNTILYPQLNLEDVARSVQIIKELERYCLSEYGIDAISIHFNNDLYIYESSSSYPIDIYLKKLSKESGINVETLKPLFSSSEEICYISGMHEDEQNHSMIYVFMPLYYENRTSGVIQLSVSRQTLLDVISPALASIDSTAVLLYHDELLTADTSINEIWRNWRSAFECINDDKSNCLLNTDSGDYFIQLSRSESSSLKCLTITPTADYIKLSKHNSQRLFTLLTIVITCCGILIAFLITRQYRPISSLMTMATNIAPENPHTRLESVYDTFSELVTINQHLQTENKSYTENRLIYNLLKGASIDNPQQKNLLMMFEGAAYITVLVSTTFVNDRATLLEKIREKSRDHFRAMLYTPVTSDDVIVLLSCRSKEEDSINSAILQIHENLTNSLKAEITFGVGNPVESLSDIPQSYSDAAYALESMLIKGKGTVIHINDLDDQDDYHHLFPYREADILHSYILSGDAEEASRILKNLIEFIRNSRFSITVAHRICADIYNRTLRALEYTHAIPDTNAVKTQFGHLSDYETLDDLINAMSNMFEELFHSISIKQNQGDQTRGETMREYIRNNCLSVNFSLQHMADDLNMAMTNLCHYYRSVYNQTILDYATEYRIEKACLLLRESNLSIVEISERVGYATPSGFIRRFKQVMGVTPGKYNHTIDKSNQAE